MAKNKGTAVLGPKLRAWRDVNGITLKEVGGALDVSEATISDWERGKRFPSRRNLDALAKYFDIPVCALFCEDGEGCRWVGWEEVE